MKCSICKKEEATIMNVNINIACYLDNLPPEDFLSEQQIYNNVIYYCDECWGNKKTEE